jgi:hypothetical protein
MKRILLCGLAAVCLFAQQPSATDVNINDGPTRNAYQKVIGYDAAGNTTYRCWSLSSDTNGARTRRGVSISAASNANPVVFTSVGHGFDLNSRPIVTISGGTNNWTAVNGLRTATVIDADTFSVAVNSSALGAVSGSLVFRTTAPRLNQDEWAVNVFRYDASGQAVWEGWLGGSSTFQAKCSDAASTTLNIQ